MREIKIIPRMCKKTKSKQWKIHPEILRHRFIPAYSSIGSTIFKLFKILKNVFRLDRISNMFWTLDLSLALLWLDPTTNRYKQSINYSNKDEKNRKVTY